MEVDDPQVHARIPTRTTRDTSSPNIGMRTGGLSPSVANRSRNISAYDVWVNGRLTTPHVPEGIRFELCRFRSLLLTTSRLISLPPPPTEMFQFGGSQSLRIASCEAGGPIRVSPDHRFLAPTRSLSQLGTPFIGTRTEPSTDRLVSACLYDCVR